MKKFLCVSILLSMFCGVTNVHAASTDDIRNACYATKKCGAKGHIQTMTAIPFTAGGAVVGAVGGMGLGTLVPWAAGPGVGFVVGGAAGGYGGYLVGNQLGGYLAKSYNANEYLYFNDGTCLECDTYQMGEHYECPNGTIVSNGSYFYRCRTETFGDSWEEYRPLPCRNSPIKDTSVKGAMYEIKATVDKVVKSGVYVYSGDMCLYITCGDGVLDKETNSCVPNDNGGDEDGDEGGEKCGVNSVRLSLVQQKDHDEFLYQNKATYDQVNNHHKKQKGLAGNVYECDKQICGDNKEVELDANHVFKGKLVTTKKKYICRVTVSDDYWEEVPTKVNTCLTERTTAAGKACCYLAESVATFENGKCVCSGGKTFSIDDYGKGRCTGGSGGDEGDDLIPVTQCVTVLNELSLFVKTNCMSLSTKVESLMKLCMSGQLTVAMLNSENKIIRDSCYNQEGESKQKLVDAAEKLDTMFAGFKVSKWKNEEGKFNTARLASDSIAGVVLGTTGGLITSSVMKKKQVEQGFEDLRCVVGGQPVAGWGDEFMVGIQ